MAVDDSYVVSQLEFNSSITDEAGLTWNASSTPQYTTGVFDKAINFTGSYHLSAPRSTGFNFSSGDFTIEFFLYITSASGQNIFSDYDYTNNGNAVYLGSGGLLYAKTSISGNNSIAASSNIAIPLNKWNHVAVVRNGTSFKVAVNGTFGTSTTLSGAVLNPSSATMYIAAYKDGSGNAAMQMDKFKVSKGIARYTSDFTPPSSSLYFPQIT